MATPFYEFNRLPQLPLTRTPGPRLRRVRDTGEAPIVGVIHNPHSHRNMGSPIADSVSDNIHIARPETRAHLPAALARFAAEGIDLLVIDGGDGTIRDVLTAGQAVFGNHWPAIAVLPKGKTNALAFDLELTAGWSLEQAIGALDHGRRITRRPMTVASLDHSGAAAEATPIMGFILGAGAFTKATEAGQSAHRLGAFDSMVVAATGVWALLQSLLAGRSNAWRKGAAMRIGLGSDDNAMAHSGRGDPAMRQILFASTLDRLPAGIKPFGALRKGLKLLAVDQISRTTTLRIPLVLLGKLRRGLRERGIHQVATNRFTLAIAERFILDGEAFPPGRYSIAQGPELVFVAP